jgi:transcriptional regulator with XRE-family HTH domain
VTAPRTPHIEFTKGVGRRLAYIRLRRHYTQEDIAEWLNVSRWSVSRWERGYHVPDLLNAVALTNIYEVSLDWLIGRKRT